MQEKWCKQTPLSRDSSGCEGTLKFLVASCEPQSLLGPAKSDDFPKENLCNDGQR